MVKRFRSPVRANIGKARLASSDTSSEASFTRSVNTQMARIIKNYEAWVNHMKVESAQVLKEALEPTFAKSQKLVPVDTKTLKNSGYLETRVFRGRSVVEIGYARRGFPAYAAIVHEDLDVFHKSPTKAKFLEIPLDEDASAIQKRIIAKFKEASSV